MRPALVNAFATMLPRLQAEELLAMRGAIAAGTGSMKQPDEKAWLAAMQKQAGIRSGQRIRTLDDLRATGIRVVEGGEG